MNVLLWPLLGLIWSLWGLLLFLVPAAAVRRLRRLAAEGLFLPELRGEIPRDLSFLWDQLRSGRPILRPLRIVPEACGMLRSC